MKIVLRSELFKRYGTASLPVLKHTTTLFALTGHYILSWEWRVIVDQVQTSYHSRPTVQ